MKVFSPRYLISIGLGITWGVVYCALSSSLPLVQRLELDVQDSLIRLHGNATIPETILLLKISQSDLSGYDLHNLSKLNAYYAALVKSLIENGASVVVVNLPDQMKQYADNETNTHLEHPFKETIRQYSDQIVLVTRPNNVPSEISTLNIYNNLLPFDDESADRSIAPEKIISYFRYAPNPQNLNSPARRADLFSHFSYEDDPNPDASHGVQSVATLALEKFYSAANDRTGLEALTKVQGQAPVQINFWGPANTFPSIHFQLHCSASSQGEAEQCSRLFKPQPLPALRNRLILIDLPEGNASEHYRERSPYGEMSIAEVQANLIASLMTRSFLTMAPKGVDYAITTLGIVLMSLFITSQSKGPKGSSAHLLKLWWFLGFLGSYLGFSLLLFWQGLMLPLSIPLLGWLGTGSGIFVYLMFKQAAQQRQKLAERQAALLQARKLLHRIATDIHDGPLQELKLVMDSLELLEINHPSPLISPILDRLEAIGLAFRHQLSNTRTLAEKLEITPELELGLASGIQQWLHQSLKSGELTLEVQASLQPLREPKSDSPWIDAREDIFQFFREALTNVIRHAQPPNGTATRVSIHLSQEGTHCRLAIENDGTPELLTVLGPKERKRQRGGYGTKLMTTVATQLPNGVWQRVPLEAGGMQVTLQWTMDML